MIENKYLHFERTRTFFVFVVRSKFYIQIFYMLEHKNEMSIPEIFGFRLNTLEDAPPEDPVRIKFGKDFAKTRRTKDRTLYEFDGRIYLDMKNHNVYPLVQRSYPPLHGSSTKTVVTYSKVREPKTGAWNTLLLLATR